MGIKVHKALGHCLLESAYEESLYYEIQKYGLFVEKQKALPLIYKDIKMEVGYRMDLLVEKKLILEIKSVESLHDLHLAQILTTSLRTLRKILAPLRLMIVFRKETNSL